MSTEQNNGKPAVSPKRNLLNDRRIRLLLSLLGAVIAWMAVTIVVQPGTTTTIYNVPVDFSYDSAAYTSRGLSIVNAEEKTVNLKLSGDGYTIGSLSANDFVVYPDWSSVRDSGEKSLRLQVRSQSTCSPVCPSPSTATTPWTWCSMWWKKDPAHPGDDELPEDSRRLYPLRHRHLEGDGDSLRTQHRAE